MTPLAAMILEHISDVYANWRAYGAPYGRHEPSITTGWIKQHLDELHSSRVPSSYDRALRRQRYRMIQSALGELVRSGHLIPSLGIGLRGREARVYEPARRDPARRRAS